MLRLLLITTAVLGLANQAAARSGQVTNAATVGQVAGQTPVVTLGQVAPAAAATSALTSPRSPRKVCVFNFGVQVAGSARNARIDNRVNARNLALVCR